MNVLQLTGKTNQCIHTQTRSIQVETSYSFNKKDAFKLKLSRYYQRIISITSTLHSHKTLFYNGYINCIVCKREDHLLVYTVSHHRVRFPRSCLPICKQGAIVSWKRTRLLNVKRHYLNSYLCCTSQITVVYDINYKIIK